jgi:magnesium transporter
MVDTAIYVDGRRSARPADPEETVEALRGDSSSTEAAGDGAPGHDGGRRPEEQPPGANRFCWIGLLRPGEDELRSVAEKFGLHPLAVEDAIQAHQRPKLERYGETLFVVLRPAHYVDPVEVVDIGELHLFLGPDFVVVVRHAEKPPLAEVRQRLEADPELLRQGPVAVLYGVLDRVVDDYGPVLEGLRNDIDEIETQVFGGDPGVSRRIYQLSREVIEFQRAVEPLNDILAEVRGRLVKRSGEDALELNRLLRDVADHATQVCERVEGFRQLLANILQVNAALVAQRQNEEMTRLTEASYEQNEQVKRISSIAAILFTPTVVAGVYGMNFQHMPELSWTFGYPMSLGLMLLLMLVLYLIFRYRGWL